MAKRYRMKPVEVEAIQFDGENFRECSDFVGTGDFGYDGENTPMKWMSIDQPSHYSSVDRGDWIIKADDGHFDVYTQEAFTEYYKPIGGDDQ